MDKILPTINNTGITLKNNISIILKNIFVFFFKQKTAYEIKECDWSSDVCSSDLEKKEKTLLKLLYDFPQVVSAAAEGYSPAQIANYCYELAKEYNQLYHDLPILKEGNISKRVLRLMLSGFTSQVLRSAMGLLGIQLPERM